MHPDDKEKTYIDINKHFCGETPFYSNEHRVLCKDGTYKWILDKGKIVEWTEDNNPKRMIGTHADITDQKKAEIQLKELNTSKDKFFSIVAHDLKGPLSSIIGLLETLNNRYDELEKTKQKKMLGAIQAGIQNSYNLLEDLMLWSRSQRGIIDYSPKKENLFSITDEILDMMSLSAEKKSISISNQIPKDVFITADRNMLSTILRNLLSNAIKFTPHEGAVKLNAEYEKNKSVKVSVTDTGIGISLEQITKLFDINENQSTPGTDNEKGTGLGLILCKEFVEKQGGTISVKSKIHEGTSFYFTIPVAP